jgi:SAM-dependent methyltransferase
MRTFPEPAPESLGQKYSAASFKYSPEADTEQQRVLFTQFSQRILDTIHKYCSPPGRLLDVGCNHGNLLRIASDRGWSVAGLEVNPDVASYATMQGFDVQNAFLEANTLPSNNFDVLVAECVLEHVPNPVQFLEAARRVVRPHGIIYIGVPCFLGPIPLFLKRDSWYSLLPDEHIWQFSERSLKNLVRSLGLQILKTQRGCSDFRGSLTLHPKSWARYFIYTLPRVSGMGDFVNVVLRNSK